MDPLSSLSAVCFSFPCAGAALGAPVFVSMVFDDHNSLREVFVPRRLKFFQHRVNERDASAESQP